MITLKTEPEFRRVLIESPFAGSAEINRLYARAALRDSLARGEAPLASHLLYTQPGVLRDNVPAEREQGIETGLAWGAVAHATVVYTDLGITSGMRRGITRANLQRRPVEYRTLPLWAAHVAECRTSSNDCGGVYCASGWD